MNRPLTALHAFLDALTVAVLGIGVILLPLTIVWIAQFQLGVDFSSFWNVAANFWLLGNGVDLLVTVDPALALRLALDGAGIPFEIGFAPLGFAVLTVLLAYRSGRRFSEAPYRVLGTLIGIVTMGVVGGLVAASSTGAAAMPSLTQAVVFPAAIYAIGMVIGLYSQPVLTRIRRERSVDNVRLEDAVLAAVDRLPTALTGMIGVILRGGAMAVAAIMVVSGLLVAVVVLGNYGTIIGLYEQLQAGIVGGIPLTLLQLSVIPNLVIWAASWLVGPGFAVGTGSVVSATGTSVGLLPSVPILGALPTGASPFGYLGIIVPVVIGFAVGAVLRPRLTELGEWAGSAVIANPIVRSVLAAAGIGVVGASVFALLAVWSGGAAGPGRLADIGPEPGAVWLWLAIELTVSSLLGCVFGLVMQRRDDDFADDFADDFDRDVYRGVDDSGDHVGDGSDADREPGGAQPDAAETGEIRVGPADPHDNDEREHGGISPDGRPLSDR